MSPTRHLKLTLISGDPDWARTAISAGVDRVLVDLETLGKSARQKGRGLFLSSLGWEDVAATRAVIPRGTLMVRLDPLHDGSVDQVEKAIELGADLLMLPYFSRSEDVLQFCEIVRGRVPVVPLVERLSAVEDIERLIRSNAVSEFHVGMNDLAIDAGLKSHVDLWQSTIVLDLARKAQRHAMRFGVGGVTDPRSEGLDIDPSWIIAQQARLGSSSALLGRHFRDHAVAQPDLRTMKASVAAIRECFASNLDTTRVTESRR